MKRILPLYAIFFIVSTSVVDRCYAADLATDASSRGKWYVDDAGYTSVHNALQACGTLAWGPDITIKKLKQILQNAKEAGIDAIDILKNSSLGISVRDIAVQYCPAIAQPIEQNYDYQKIGSAQADKNGLQNTLNQLLEQQKTLPQQQKQQGIVINNNFQKSQDQLKQAQDQVNKAQDQLNKAQDAFNKAQQQNQNKAMLDQLQDHSLQVLIELIKTRINSSEKPSLYEMQNQFVLGLENMLNSKQ